MMLSLVSIDEKSVADFCWSWSES